MNKHIESILQALQDITSKSPMRELELCEKLNLEWDEFTNLMDEILLLHPSPVGRMFNIKGNFAGYVYWPTGIVDKGNWKNFTPAKSKKAQELLTSQLQSEQAIDIPVFIAKSETESSEAVIELSSDSFRCAYTNDHCLMLIGLEQGPVELNADRTNTLIEFISETVTPIGVAI